jgi:hypothetical protein
MGSEHMISVARDFSRTPGPRYVRQGNWSGEKFRKRLEEELRQYERVVVDLDGTRGYGSSFLDEAFGGLVREGVLTREEAFRRLDIRSTQDPTYKVEAEQAIRLARHMG